MNNPTYDVIIVGGGPAGLSAAMELKKLGVSNVLVVERESVAGGIPRHCGHPPFGMYEFRRVLSGPSYAKRLVETALTLGVEIKTNTTVVRLIEGGGIQVSNRDGLYELYAKKVILATGVRETPRSARLISGDRPLGVINTGALQSYIYLKKKKPFLRPVIVGTELVSFSAIWTCVKKGIKPVAMIEPNKRVTAYSLLAWFPKLLGIPLMLNTKVEKIIGTGRVEQLQITHADGKQETLECDGVLLTGSFTPESTLIRNSHLALNANSGGPVIDQYGRCSDHSFYALGNLLRPVETAGWSFREGKKIAKILRTHLVTDEPKESQIQIVVSDPIKYCVPSVLSASRKTEYLNRLQLRVKTAVTGTLVFSQGSTVLLKKKIHKLPERRLLVYLDELGNIDYKKNIEVTIEE